MAVKDPAVARLRILSIIALCCSFVACFALIVALATDHWQDIEVNRAGLLKIVEYKPELEQPINNDVLYFDRHRGLFYYCRAVLRRIGVIPDTICVRDLAFEQSPVIDLSHVTSSSELNDIISDLKTRRILVITITVLVIVADVCALFASVTGFAALFTSRRRSLYTAAMSWVFLATVFAGSSIAIFHGLDFLERTKLDVYMFPAAIQEERFYDELSTHTRISPGYSYYAAWLGVVMASGAAIVYLYVRKAHGLAATAIGANSSTSTLHLSESSTGSNRRRRSSSAKMPPPLVYNNAYAMMESSNSADVSEKDSSRTPSSEDWNPDQELPPDDPIHFM